METIRSIFAFYNLDMAVHNSYPVENPEEQQVNGDEEAAGADIADDTRLQAGEVEGDEVRAEAQALGDEPAEKDNASEDEFAAGEQEGHIEEFFLNISDDIEGAMLETRVLMKEALFLLLMVETRLLMMMIMALTSFSKIQKHP